MARRTLFIVAFVCAAAIAIAFVLAWQAMQL